MSRYKLDCMDNCIRTLKSHAMQLEADRQIKFSEDLWNIIDYLKSLPTQPQADKWIPCSERLPSEDMNVLVQDYFGTLSVFSLTKHLDIDGDRMWEDERGCWFQLDEIEAWQPLPIPYKKEGAE